MHICMYVCLGKYVLLTVGLIQNLEYTALWPTEVGFINQYLPLSDTPCSVLSVIWCLKK